MRQTRANVASAPNTSRVQIAPMTRAALASQSTMAIGSRSTLGRVPTAAGCGIAPGPVRRSVPRSLMSAAMTLV
jgi:hypothetical protein